MAAVKKDVESGRKTDLSLAAILGDQVCDAPNVHEMSIADLRQRLVLHVPSRSSRII